MRALTYQAANDTFTIKNLITPQPGPTEVCVKVHAIGLNPVDAKINFWHSAAPGMNDDWVPGLDVSGEIVAIGSEVRDWKIGDRVLYHGDMFKPHGGFAEYALHAAATLTPHPNTDAVLAAATPCSGWTAWRALIDKLRIDLPQNQDKRLLIMGGSGGVGSFAIQIAKHFGIKTIITTCSTRNHDYVRQLGATHVVDYNTTNVTEEVLRLTDGQGVKMALDAVGGDNDVLAANALGYEGQLVELVSTLRPAEYRDAFMKGLSFHQLSLGSGHRNGPRAIDDMVNAGKAVSALLEAGIITPPQIQTVSLDDAAEALLSIRQGRTVGKVVLTF